MQNLIFATQCKLKDKAYGNGLESYTQSNCQVTLTDSGFRIYRPPNVNPTDNKNTMWGGLKLQPHYARTNGILFKGHSYIILFDVKGKSSNGLSGSWTNQMGWGGGGLMPSPSNVSQVSLPSNFNGSMKYWYRFTINDEIYKVCTSTYSIFIQGTTYLSYRDFAWGFGYTNTGSLGTDLYLTNFRMYDITSYPELCIDKSGKMNIGYVIENDEMNIGKSTELQCKEIIEI